MFAGRYAIEREIGHGATATVFLARDTQHSRGVAVKVLRPELAETMGAARFLRETRISEGLQHPHIVAVLDAGEADGKLYLVLPFMEGGSLRQRLQRQKQLPVDEAIGIARTVGRALEYAHKQGLIHRDVKPENILFTSGQACLADFGIARAIERTIDESTTSTGLVRGTPAYMSPEQASGSSDYDGRSDQYSLALVLYEMLAGMPAFIGPTPEAVIAQRFYHAPRPLHVYRRNISTAVEDVISRALSLTPADRYPDLGAFVTALDDAQRQPVIARRPSSPVRRMHPATLAIGVSGLLLLGATGTYVATDWRPWQPPPDTTRYVLLPIESEPGLPAAEASQRLHVALGAWSGVTSVSPFEIVDAIGDSGAPLTDRAANRLARRVGAGRYVRARLASSADSLRLTVAAFEVGRPATISEAGVAFAPAAMRRATDSLVSLLFFRRAIGPEPGSSSVPAVQLFLASLEARKAFDLRTADTLLLQALARDRDFGRAALGLAQVRSWKEDDVTTWLPWAERAAMDRRLRPDERELAAALVGMGRRTHLPACATLRRAAMREAAGFESWMNLATCLRSDNAVVHDARSPSGWRFQASYQEAVDAYVRAFQLAPALHQTFQAGGFERLRRLLFTAPLSVRAGRTVPPDSVQRFFAYASWRGDSLHFVPYPDWMMPRGLIPVDSSGRQAAVRRQRNLFREVAQSWAAALPTNSSAKEALAISLEMVGDRAALDTLRVARAMPADVEQRARMAAEEVLMRVSLGRGDPRYLPEAARLADSLLGGLSDSSARIVTILRPIAAVSGRCRAASRFAARSVESRNAEMHGVPLHVYAATESLTVLATLGCDERGVAGGLSAVEQAIAAVAAEAPTVVARRQYNLLARVIRANDVVDSTRLAKYAAIGGDQLLVARLNLLRGDSTKVRAFLDRPQTVALADRSPDLVLSEARLFLALGDTAGVKRWLSPVLDRVSWLEIMLDRPMEAAALLRAAALMADVSAGSDADSPTAWAAFPRTLWKNADAELLSPPRPTPRR